MEKEKNHLNKYYNELNWGEDLNTFIIENIELLNNYNGKFFQFLEKDNQIAGGLFFYFNHLTNSNAIGCAAIDPLYRGRNHYKTILTTFTFLYSRLYLFSKPHLVKLYSEFFKNKIYIQDMDIYLFSNYEITIEHKGPFF